VIAGDIWAKYNPYHCHLSQPVALIQHTVHLFLDDVCLVERSFSARASRKILWEGLQGYWTCQWEGISPQSMAVTMTSFTVAAVVNVSSCWFIVNRRGLLDSLV